MKQKLATLMVVAGILMMSLGLYGCLGQDDPAPSPGAPDTTQPSPDSTTPGQGPENTQPSHVQYPNEGTLPETGGLKWH